MHCRQASTKKRRFRRYLFSVIFSIPRCRRPYALRAGCATEKGAIHIQDWAVPFFKWGWGNQASITNGQELNLRCTKYRYLKLKFL